jgi:hypothetical protein
LNALNPSNPRHAPKIPGNIYIDIHTYVFENKELRKISEHMKVQLGLEQRELHEQELGDYLLLLVSLGLGIQLG